MSDNGYLFTAPDFPRLLEMVRYPEQTAKQTEVLRAYFQHHLFEFDRVIFEFRVGAGMTPDPTLLPSVQQNAVFLTRPRIDVLAWMGSQPTIIESKDRVTPSSLGQVLTYRLHLTKEFPDALEPKLLVIGRFSDPDTIEPLNAAGVTVYLYPEATAGGAAAVGSV
jgi:hypothetical protein